MFLFIVTLLLLLLVKCSKNFNTSNPISHEINKTINDSKKSIEETEPTRVLITKLIANTVFKLNCTHN